MIKLHRVLPMMVFVATYAAQAQHQPAAVAAKHVGTVPVVMLSDLHFDPFLDPAKFPRLLAAPATAWQAILAEPASATQTADYAKLNTTCHLRGNDSSWALLESSLKAAHADSPHPLFVTVSGDLVAHEFDCRFEALAPNAAPEAYSGFATKTVAYVTAEVRRAFPATPIYFTLGNNDSGCGDYRETSQSPFLLGVKSSFTPKEEAGVSSFAESGSYSVALPAPIVRGRLIVLQDSFLAVTFKGCDGTPNPAAGAAQIAWLRKELSAARDRNEQVWVMAHIPPGLDMYNTISKNRDVCAGQPPVMFLGDDQLVDVLTDFAPEIRLALFAHTHMDEMKILRVGQLVKQKKHGVMHAAEVAAKLVPSVSPINGNLPAFTVAEVDPQTAIMRDYRVVAADNRTGIAAKWSDEYRFSTTFGLSSYAPEQLTPMLDGFVADKQSASAGSNAYEDHFIVGGGLKTLALRLVWPQYACGLENNTAAEFKACVCPATPAAPPAKP